MAPWPGNPVGWLNVQNFKGGTGSFAGFHAGVSTSQRVNELDLEWTINVQYDDYPWFDHGRGWFRATLRRLSDDGRWVRIDRADRTLGNDDDDGHWSATLPLRARMDREVEVYVIEIECGTEATSGGTSTDVIRKQFMAIQGSQFVGHFSLDFHPVSIVYSPPNQDMTSSLTQSLEYGTRMTIGMSEGFQAETRTDLEVSALGVKIGGVSTTDSRSLSNRSEAGIEVSYFRNTVLTADNQRAIGRAYWGPLADVFVIAVGPRFAVSRRADGTLFYTPESMEQIIVAPAYKLLRPGNDPVLGRIPDDVRRRLLELDPFLKNLDRFFPDSGDPLATAADPYADPTASNRAERLGRWWLNTGTELNYSIGEAKQLKTGEATEIQFASTLTFEAGLTVNLFDVIGVGAQTATSFTTTLGLQSSKETVAGSSRTASCYLIRNQNEKDLDAIEIYYDKTFSTLMFRKVRARRRRLIGSVVDLQGAKLMKADVTLRRRGDSPRTTVTDDAGRFEFDVEPGNCSLTLGTQSWELAIPRNAAESSREPDPSPIRIDLTDVRRPIDLARSPAWALIDALGIDSDAAWRLSRHSDRVFDAADLATILGFGRNEVIAATRNLDLTWPATELSALPGIVPEEVRGLRAAGVASAQDLWQRAQEEQDLEPLSQRAGVSSERLRELITRANSKRASMTKEGAPEGGRIDWRNLNPRWARALLLRLRRRAEFRRTRTYRRLFGTARQPMIEDGPLAGDDRGSADSPRD